MTASFESPRRRAVDASPGTHRRGWWQNAPTARAVLAVAFVAILLSVVDAIGQGPHLVASAVGFATAITLIAVGVIGWERLVASSQSAGLVERSAEETTPAAGNRSRRSRVRRAPREDR